MDDNLINNLKKELSDSEIKINNLDQTINELLHKKKS